MEVKKLLGTLAIVLLVLTAVGCKKEPKVVYPEEIAEPAKEIREKTMETKEDVLDWGESSLNLISELKCDTREGTGIFSFKLTNPTDKTYVLGKVSALETNVNPLKVKVNGRIFDYSYCRNGEGDIMTFAPGAVRTCTREFNPTEVTTGDFIIRTGLTGLGTPVENRLFVQSNDFVSEVLFKCD